MLREGMEISPYYDSMLGKVIAFGNTREEAIEKLAAALEQSSLLGITTNRSFLVKLLRHAAFRTEKTCPRLSFRNISRTMRAAPTNADENTWLLAAWLADGKDARPISEEWCGWSNAQPLPRIWWLSHGGELRRGTAASARGGTAISMENAQTAFDNSQSGFAHAWRDDELWLQTGAADYLFMRETFRQPVRKREEDSDGIARAPLNAKVSQVSVSAGDVVAEGQSLMVLEAMKMEHHILAAAAGKVKSISVHAGDQVVPGQVLAQIEVEATTQAPPAARH
jgi:geranyl-CoA carboxylase alpha subunit